MGIVLRPDRADWAESIAEVMWNFYYSPPRAPKALGQRPPGQAPASVVRAEPVTRDVPARAGKRGAFPDPPEFARSLSTQAR